MSILNVTPEQVEALYRKHNAVPTHGAISISQNVKGQMCVCALGILAIEKDPSLGTELGANIPHAIHVVEGAFNMSPDQRMDFEDGFDRAFRDPKLPEAPGSPTYQHGAAIGRHCARKFK